MPDRRQHRGPHPEDARLFASCCWPSIQMATVHLSWLLSRNYVITSALKLVGDRFALDARQRLAVRRSACSDAARTRRVQHQAQADQIRGRVLDIDGFNLLTNVEAALGGGVILRGRDGCLRDMASVHGSYRKVAETLPALAAIGEVLATLQPAACIWWLDRPVSNSGRVSQLIMALAGRRNWPWQTQLVADPDPLLQESSNIVVTADSVILDKTRAWFDLASIVVAEVTPDAWIVPAGMACPVDQSPPHDKR